MGIQLAFEENEDIQEEYRIHWWVMVKFPEVLEEYKALRLQGFNPIFDFNKFRQLLSYGTAWGESADNVVPKMRGESKIKGIPSSSRIIFNPGDWPIKKEARLK
jgi:hypothetical protein